MASTEITEQVMRLGMLPPAAGRATGSAKWELGEEETSREQHITKAQ